MRTVTVTGHGEARVAPDSAVVRVAAVHRAAGVADALAGADSAARQIVATGREHTTPERVGSTAVQIWPSHDQQGSPNGFEARHSLTIRCSDIGAAGALLSALAESVGDRLQIEGVSLEVGDRSGAETAAREAAYADAVERATHLAGLAGCRAGRAPGRPRGRRPHRDPPRRRRMAAPASLELEPGEQGIDAAVTVVFQLALDRAGPTTWATSAADRPTYGSPEPGVACAPAAYTPGERRAAARAAAEPCRAPARRHRAACRPTLHQLARGEVDPGHHLLADVEPVPRQRGGRILVAATPSLHRPRVMTGGRPAEGAHHQHRVAVQHHLVGQVATRRPPARRRSSPPGGPASCGARTRPARAAVAGRSAHTTTSASRSPTVVATAAARPSRTTMSRARASHDRDPARLQAAHQRLEHRRRPAARRPRRRTAARGTP